MNENDRLAYVGLGSMGLPMALNLQNHLKENSRTPLVVYNRTASKAQALAEAGATVAHSLAEVVEKANIIFTSLANDQALTTVYEELLEVSKNGKEIIFVEMSTVYPTTIADLVEKTEKVPNRHIAYCPVWGPPAVAKNAQLIIITSGNNHALERVQPYLVPVLGRKIISVGEDARKGASFKLNGNFFVVGIVELLSEGLTLAEKSGLGQSKLMEFLDAFFPFGSFQTYGQRIENDSFRSDVGFTVDNALKDIRHMRRLAEESGAQLPVVDIAFQHLISAKANGASKYDWSSMVGALRMAAAPSKPTFTLIREDIFLPSSYDGSLLEARVSYYSTQAFQKAGEQLKPLKGVIISHPYGPLGGNNHNNVVVALEYFFLKHGYLTIAFNFRGSGRSKGSTSWTGEPENGDYSTMLEFLAHGGKTGGANGELVMQIPFINEVVIAGYSYGSLIATSISSISSTFSFPISFIIISYPASVIWFLTCLRTKRYKSYLDALLVSDSPVLFVYGNSDQFTSVAKYQQWIEESGVREKKNWDLREIEDADHFWGTNHMEHELNKVLDEWILNGRKRRETVQVQH
ncbi:hypothetical protein G9A89_018199 [Geosiphon pyriformis]|nr:hypothetical protein G9A89_018199 [Geosiphon pyriformis]